MTPDIALQQLRDGELRGLYLVVGEEHQLREQAVATIKASSLEGGIAGLNEDQFDAAESGVEDVLAAARTTPMMASRRYVSVRSLDRWEGKTDGNSKNKVSTAPLDQVLDYANDPVPSTVLVLTASKLDPRRRLFKAAKKQGWLVSCEPLSDQALRNWLEGAVKQRGVSLGPGVAHLLAETTGPSLSNVEDALERLSLYVGDGGVITEDVTAECLSLIRPATVWELLSAIGDRDVGRTLSILPKVYEAQDRGLRLLGVLAWSTRQLIRFEAALAEGMSPPDAAKAAKAPPFKARDLAAQVKRISRLELESWLATLARVDLELKGGSKRPPLAILEYALIDMCRAGTRRRQAAPHRPGRRA